MNSNKFSLFNNYFIIFLIIIVIVVSFLIFYNIIKPNKNTSSAFLNFQPYPSISPKDIPDNVIGNTINSCYNKLTKCNLKDPINLQCNSCSGDFTCTQVDKTQNINTNLKINGENVPDTNPNEGWCIPTLPETLKCNSFTGKWVWSNDENCSNDRASSQCWSCECRYPDLFNGSDCSTQLACKAVLDNANISKESIIGQDGNLLVSTQHNLLGSNIIWNPNKQADKMTPNEIKVLMEQSPYDSDENNKPYFSCLCGNYPCMNNEDCENAGMKVGYICTPPQEGLSGSCTPYGSSSNTYMNLENDPYMCHINPCGKINNFSTSNSIPVKGLCSNDSTKSCDSLKGCDEGNFCNFICECPNNFIQINENNFNATKDSNILYGTCITLDEIGCSFDTVTKECLCPVGYNRQCRSNYANVNNPNVPEENKCVDPNNPTGYECFNPCPTTTCNYRGIPAYKTGKCANDTKIDCVSNGQCGSATGAIGTGNNVCVHSNDCTCVCNNTNKNTDICDTLNTQYKGATGPTTNLENICNQYGDVCQMVNDSCISKDLKPIFVGCDKPYYGGKDCENYYCGPNTNVSCDLGTITNKGGGVHSFKISGDKLYFCEDLKDKDLTDLSKIFKKFNSDGTWSYGYLIDDNPAVGNAYCNGTTG